MIRKNHLKNFLINPCDKRDLYCKDKSFHYYLATNDLIFPNETIYSFQNRTDASRLLFVKNRVYTGLFLRILFSILILS